MLEAAQIAELVQGELRGDAHHSIRRVAPLDQADSEALSFVASSRYTEQLKDTAAGIVIVSESLAEHVPASAVAVIAKDPQAAFRRVLLELHPERKPEPGIDSTANVAPGATIDPTASVGAFAVIEDGVVVGPRCRIGAHVSIGQGSRLAEDVTIHDGATLYWGVTLGSRVTIHSGARIGKPGFGFVWEDGGHRRVPQVGGCRLEADVEIGANSTVDRGALGDTLIGTGTKIDNLVHIGHNVQIGAHVIIIAQVGVSGSTRIGDGAILAGQAGIQGHIEIGAQARIGGQAGVLGDVPAGETVSGYPARPHREALRAQAGFFKLPEILRRLKRVEELLEKLKG